MAGANSQRGAASGPSSNILIFWHTPWGPLCISIFEEFDRIPLEQQDLVPCFSYCNYHRENQCSEQQKQRTICNAQGIHRLHKNDLQISFCQKKTFGIKKKYVFLNQEIVPSASVHAHNGRLHSYKLSSGFSDSTSCVWFH